MGSGWQRFPARTEKFRIFFKKTLGIKDLWDKVLRPRIRRACDVDIAVFTDVVVRIGVGDTVVAAVPGVVRGRSTLPHLNLI